MSASVAPLPWRVATRAIDRGVSHALWRATMSFHKPLMFVDFYRRAYKHVKMQRFDVYHAHDLNTLPVAALLARKTDGSLVYDSHELYPEMSTMGRLERLVWKRVERFLIRRPDAVITVCDSIANELADRYDIPTPLTLLNCPKRFHVGRSAGVNRLRERVGLLDSESPIILYQGGFAPNRGLEQLIDASRFIEDATVVLMGWGRIEDDLREQIARENLMDRVLITQPASVDELVTITSGADIGVIPYQAIGLNNYYTTPNKLFEYIAAGLPIVGSRFPELCRFIEGLEIGRTCDPEDPYDIAFVINGLLAAPDLRARMRENARIAAETLVWEVESEKLVDFYGSFGIKPLSVSAPRPDNAPIDGAVAAG